MAPAYAGYRRYRKALLENGVELYELRTMAGGFKRGADLGGRVARNFSFGRGTAHEDCNS